MPKNRSSLLVLLGMGRKVINNLIPLIIVAVFLSLAHINIASAVTIFKDTSIPLPNPLGEQNIIQIINKVINFLIYISVPILALLILWGGFQILTARADPEKVKNGRKTILYASIGFAVILVSKGIAIVLLEIIGG